MSQETENGIEVYANPGGEARYGDLNAALEGNGIGGAQIEWHFQTPYQCETLSRQTGVRITFDSPVFLNLTADMVTQMGDQMEIGTVSSMQITESGNFVFAEGLINEAIDQFIIFGTPQSPIRSTLRLLKGEEYNENILVSWHVEAGMVLDMLEEDKNFYGEELPQQTLDDLQIEDPLEEIHVTRTNNYPLVKITYQVSTSDPNQVEAIIIEKLDPPKNLGSEQVYFPENAAYTVNLLFKLLKAKSSSSS